MALAFRGNAAELERIIDDGHEEIGRRDQCLLVVEFVDGGVVSGFDTDQQLLGQQARTVLENFREYARRDLQPQPPAEWRARVRRGSTALLVTGHSYGSPENGRDKFLSQRQTGAYSIAS